MDIIIIGAQKAGTTWLFSKLKQQPRIAFAMQKEIHYFDHLCDADFDKAKRLDFIREKNAGGVNSPRKQFRDYMAYVVDPEVAYTDDWYRNIFLKKPSTERRLRSGMKLVFAEASPSYMAMPEEGVAHMARLLPDIEPILIVRDPVKRMVSGTTMQLVRAKNPLVGGDDDIIAYIDEEQVPRGGYARAIPLFRRHFRGLHIIPFLDIAERPEKVLRDIEVKYGLDEILYDALGEKNNSKSGKVALSQPVHDHIQAVCAPEYDFLRDEFGEAFLDRI